MKREKLLSLLSVEPIKNHRPQLTNAIYTKKEKSPLTNSSIIHLPAAPSQHSSFFSQTKSLLNLAATFINPAPSKKKNCPPLNVSQFRALRADKKRGAAPIRPRVYMTNAQPPIERRYI